MAANPTVSAADLQSMQQAIAGGSGDPGGGYKKIPGGYIAADGKIIDSNGQIQGTIQDAHIGPASPSGLSSYLPLAGMIGGAMAVPTDGMSLLPAMALEALGGGIGGGGAEALRAKLTGTPSNISGQAKEGAELGAAGPIVGKVIEAAMGLPAAARTLMGGVSPKAAGDMAAAAAEGGAYHMGGFMGYILSKPFGRVIGKGVEKLLGSDVDPALAQAMDSDWFKALSPEQQQSVVDQYHAEGTKPTPGNGSGGGLSRPISTANAKPFQSIEDRYAHLPNPRNGGGAMVDNENPGSIDWEGSAGLKGPQTIRGISTTQPSGNPQAVSDAIAQALRLGQGNPEIEQTVNSVLSQADDRRLPAGIKPSSAGSTYNPATDPDIKRLTNQLQDSLSGKKVSLRQIGAKGETIAQSEGLTPAEMRAWTQYRAAHQLPNNNYLDLFIQYLRHYGRPPK